MTNQLQMIGHYKIKRQIGRGSTTSVYEAFDTKLDRPVAIKLLPQEFINDPEIRERFYQEARTMVGLDHPAIVPVYDIEEADNQPYMVTRLMTGGSLQNLLMKGNPLTPEEAGKIVGQIGGALDALHGVGLIHRNVKPSNILFDNFNNAYLSDFGIVLPTSSPQRLTSTGELIGTPAYISPEQIKGQRVDVQTDVYQLGVVLFEMLTGQTPFISETTTSLILKHITEAPPSLTEIVPDLLPEYDIVIQTALAKEPEERYATAGELANAFLDILRSSSSVAIVEPVINPFVVGNPVGGTLFVGRSGIFSRLQEVWGKDTKRNVNSVVLFGHRRMGKTSILQNLSQAMDKGTLVVEFTMQRVGRVNNTGELLSYLALAIFDKLEDAGISTLTEPDLLQYEANGYQAFNRFLRDVSQIVNQSSRPTKQSFWARIFANSRPESTPIQRIILTIDEFELIEEAIADGRVDAEFLDFLRGVIHSEPWLILALAGLHTLEEMTANYWNPLFASVTPIRVSFFSRAATGNLLSYPDDKFPLEFTNAAVDRIYELAQGQPYLTQLIAYSMVSDYNFTVAERGQMRAIRFTSEDVDEVITDRSFYDQGSYYFNGVWGQAKHTGPTGQTAVMLELARSDIPVAETKLRSTLNLDPSVFIDSLQTLQQHDVIRRESNDSFDFTVPLMRRWIRQTQL